MRSTNDLRVVGLFAFGSASLRVLEEMAVRNDNGFGRRPAEVNIDFQNRDDRRHQP